jgi:hypothetical protein
MTPQEHAESKAELAKDLARIERQERWLVRRDLAWYWFIFGFAVYVLLFDHPPTWFLIVCLAAIFYWGMRDSIAKRKREKKQDALLTMLTELDSDHDYEATQERWDAYYFGVAGYHPKSTITLSRKER